MKEKKKHSEEPTGFLLWKAGNAWQRQIKLALAPAGITHVQYLLLETLNRLAAQKKPSSQAQIAEAAGIDVMMTSKVLRILVRKNWWSAARPETMHARLRPASRNKEKKCWKKRGCWC